MRPLILCLMLTFSFGFVFALDEVRVVQDRLIMETYVGFEKTMEVIVIREPEGTALDSIAVEGPSHPVFSQRTLLAKSYRFQNDTIRIPITLYSLTATSADVKDEIVITAGTETVAIVLMGKVEKSNFILSFLSEVQFGKITGDTIVTKDLEVVNYASSPISFRVEEVELPFTIVDTLYKMAPFSHLRIPISIDPKSTIPGNYESQVQVKSPGFTGTNMYAELYDTITTGRGTGPIRFRALEIPYGLNDAVYPRVLQTLLLENGSDDVVMLDSMRVVGSSAFRADSLPPLPQGVLAGRSRAFRVFGQSNGNGYRNETIVRMFYTHNGVQGVAETVVYFEAMSSLRVVPSPVVFKSDSSSTTPIEREVVVQFFGDEASSTFTVDTVWLSGPNVGSFSIVDAPVAPIIMGHGETSTMRVQCTPDSVESLTATIHVRGLTNTGRELVGVTPLLYSANSDSTDTASLKPITLRMVANNANIGETSTAVFTNTSAIADEIDSAVIALTYNASVLSPITPRLDNSDVIDEGMRTSRFGFNVSDHAIGGSIGSIQFLVALGNSSSTPLNVTGIDWFDESGNRVDVQTTVNDNFVSVLDAEGLEVNTVAGPLTLSVSPVPASRSMSVTVQYGAPSLGKLMLYDAMGSVALDLTNLMTASSGTLTFQTSGLSIGMYALRLSSGPHSAVFRILIE